MKSFGKKIGTFHSLMIGTTLFVTLFSSAARAADYYVSPDGSDSNPGTLLFPWRHLSKVSESSFVAGDRVLLEGGQIFNGTLRFGSDDTGTAANPISVSSYGEGRATINSGPAEGIYVKDSGGFNISNLVLLGAGRKFSTKNGLYFFYNPATASSRLEHVYVDNVDVSGYRNGIMVLGYLGVWGAGKAGYNDVSITNSVSHDNVSNGIWVGGYTGSGGQGYGHSNVYVGNCTASSNYADPTVSYNGQENGILVSDVDGATVERSVAHDNGLKGGGGIGIWTYEANNAVIQLSESYNNRTGSAHDGGGFDLDGGVTNSVMQYNYSHDNDGAGYLLAQYLNARPFSNNVVRYNVSENDGRKNGFGAIHFWSHANNGTNNVRNTDIYNNTVYVSPAPSGTARAVRMQSGTGSTNVRVLNNLFVTTGGVPLVKSETANSLSPAFFGNTYWSGAAFDITWNGTTYGSLSAWRAATGQEKLGTTDTGQNVDPKLTSAGNGGTIGNPANLSSLTAYKLQSDSPLINSGLSLVGSPWNLGVGSRDYYGNALPQGGAYDVGAHEFVGSCPEESPYYWPSNNTCYPCPEGQILQPDGNGVETCQPRCAGLTGSALTACEGCSLDDGVACRCNQFPPASQALCSCLAFAGGEACYPPPPSCNDGLQNQGEQGFDCGGPCPMPCSPPTCDDGAQNQNEEGMDCGGPCETPCPSPTCDDSVRNQGEQGLDCGGPCPTPCFPSTCLDGLLNQGEEGIDCGGPCTACPTCEDGKRNQGGQGIDCGALCATACPAPTCADGKHNQGEQGIDCGGAVLLSVSIQGSTLGVLANELGLSEAKRPQPRYGRELVAMAHGELDLIVVDLPGPQGRPGPRIRDLILPPSALITLISRGNEVIGPTGNTCLLHLVRLPGAPVEHRSGDEARHAEPGADHVCDPRTVLAAIPHEGRTRPDHESHPRRHRQQHPDETSREWARGACALPRR